jgi:hypothetical protein
LEPDRNSFPIFLRNLAISRFAARAKPEKLVRSCFQNLPLAATRFPVFVGGLPAFAENGTIWHYLALFGTVSRGPHSRSLSLARIYELIPDAPVHFSRIAEKTAENTSNTGPVTSSKSPFLPQFMGYSLFCNDFFDAPAPGVAHPCWSLLISVIGPIFAACRIKKREPTLFDDHSGDRGRTGFMDFSAHGSFEGRIILRRWHASCGSSLRGMPRPSNPYVCSMPLLPSNNHALLEAL